MATWRERLGGLFGGASPAATDSDLCLDPPAGFPAEQRAACCTRLIENGDPAMRARFHNARGLAYLDQGRRDEAIREISQAIAMKPQPVFFTNRASIAERAGQIDAALADLARALKLDPDYARAYEDRADIYLDLDRPAEGLSDIERALAKPTAYRYRLKGRLLMHLARYDEAVAAFDASLDLQPANHVALERRATCNLMLEHYDRAAADAEAALAAKPDMRSAHLAFATALDTSDSARALHHFGVALAADPDDGPTLNNRANVLDKLGDHAGAGADFDRAVALMPDEPIFRHNRGIWRLEAGDLSGAAADIAHGLDRDPDDASILCMKAHLAVIGGDPALADAVLAPVLTHLPNYAEAHAVTGWARLAQRRFQEAAAAFDRALEQPRGRGPGKQNERIRWTALYGRGLAREGLGDTSGDDDRASARALRPNADTVVARWGHPAPGATSTSN